MNRKEAELEARILQVRVLPGGRPLKLGFPASEGSWRPERGPQPPGTLFPLRGVPEGAWPRKGRGGRSGVRSGALGGGAGGGVGAGARPKWRRVRARRRPGRVPVAPATVTCERPGLCDPGRSSSAPEHFSRSEMGGRAAATAGMERWRGRLALVTGASSGIGAAVARALVQQGLKVVGCARTVSNIEELAAECKSAGYPGTLIPYKCDLSSEEDILSMFSAVSTQHSGVDICINNAGLAHPDSLLSGSTSGWMDMLNVNVLALSICTREAYQSMRERKVDDGHIININSMTGHRVIPQSTVHFYSATKYAVTALTEGLRQELREAQTHIRATCISPGLVETQFAFRLHDKEPEKAAATYESIKCLRPEDVAEAVIYVLSAPPHVQIGDIQMRPTEQLT